MANRNKMVHDFSQVVGRTPQRSKFTKPFRNITAFDVGQVIPIYEDEILPGDYVNIKVNDLVRMTTLIKPTMDGLYLDVMAFYCEQQFLWDGAKQFWGENDDIWALINRPTIPQVTSPLGGWEIGTIADYMGVVPKVSNLSINALLFRMYAKVINDWFRNENTTQGCHINYGSSNIIGSNGSNMVIDIEKGGMPYIASKFYDKFTACLPGPQKGATVALPLSSVAPIVAGTTDIDASKIDPSVILTGTKFQGLELDATTQKLKWKSVVGSNLGYGLQVDSSNKLATAVAVDQSLPRNDAFPSNLYADLSSATGVTINDLRQAVTVQQMLEMDARGGTRYVEYLKSHFGVDSADARNGRSEYLGGFKKPLSVHTVPQTNSTDSTSPQANLAAYSVTSSTGNHIVNKTFTEHGYLMIVAVVRYSHTYQQGMEPMWFRKDHYDFYDPIFANIGEQPIYNRELFIQGTSEDTEIFGYNEAWIDYRSKPNRVSGLMRSVAADNLAIWHYADYYTSKPILSADWNKEDKSNVARTLAVTNEPQLLADFYFDVLMERAMPVYSVPGLKRI